ncbi:MAG: hypothetical protein KAH97_09530, partial [Anaerolineales bacterium]|nr:hypothetical protein [Anaerolineales bacterium]
MGIGDFGEEVHKGTVTYLLHLLLEKRLIKKGQNLTTNGDNLWIARSHKGKPLFEMWIICGQTKPRFWVCGAEKGWLKCCFVRER